MLAKFLRRVQPNVLDGDKFPVAGRFLSAPGGVSNVDPIGRLLTGATVTRELGKGLQQHREKSVALEPNLRQLADSLGKYF